MRREQIDRAPGGARGERVPAWAGVFGVLVVAVAGCRHSGSASVSVAAPVQERLVQGPGAAPGPGAPGEALPGIALVEGHTIGDPSVLANLAVFPIYAAVDEDLGDFTTLDAALAAGTALVHELGASPEGSQVAEAERGQSAQVNTLVIENKGPLPILVLAGTMVKGGKQDRQIGQDFVVGAAETTPVDAFCVEHGRWTGTRDGKATAGAFATERILATSEVRAAGQYQRDQSEVWAKVGKMNSVHKKSSSSGTLTATLDDKDIAERRAGIAKEVTSRLRAAPVPEKVVGFAYAIDGKVQGVRWFYNHALFKQHAETLVNTAAMEAMTAQTAAQSAGQPVATGTARALEVVQFVTAVRAGRSEERVTAAANVNSYETTEEGFGSDAKMKSPAGKPGTPGKAKKSITEDYVKRSVK